MPRCPLVEADAVDRACEQQLFSVGGVASKEQRHVAILNDDRHMAHCMAWCWNKCNIASMRQAVAASEWAEWRVAEVHKAWRKPGGPVLRQRATQLTTDPRGSIVLGAAQKNLGAWEVRQAASVISVRVRQHDPTNIVGRKTKRTKLRANFLVWLHVLAHCQPKIGIPPGKVVWLHGLCRFARIDHNQPFRMLDHPDIDRQEVSLVCVEQRVDLPNKATANTMALPLLDRHCASLNRVDTHVSFPL